MAAKLMEFYERAEKEYGFDGRMKLAMLTKISSTKAEKETDSAENISAFETAMAQLRQQGKS